MNILLLSMPDSFEHMAPVAIRKAKCQAGKPAIVSPAPPAGACQAVVRTMPRPAR